MSYGKKLCQKINCEFSEFPNDYDCTKEEIESHTFYCRDFGSCHVHYIYVTLAKCKKDMYIVYTESNTSCVYFPEHEFNISDDIDDSEKLFEEILNSFRSSEDDGYVDEDDEYGEDKTI